MDAVLAFSILPNRIRTPLTPALHWHCPGTTLDIPWYHRRPPLVSKNRTPDVFAVPLPAHRINATNDSTPQTPPGITNSFDQYLRRASVALRNQQSTLQTINYAYNNASRLQTVTDNTGATAYSATHTYLANSSLLS